MTPNAIKRLKVGCEIAIGGLCGKVTCIDITDDDKIVIKWRWLWRR